MTHTLQAIAWTLVHFIWQAGAIALVYSAAARVTARRSSEVRYVLAMAALLSMLFASVLTFAIEVREGNEPNSTAPSVAAAVLPQVTAPSYIAESAATVAQSPTVSQILSARLPGYVFWIDLAWLAGICGLSLRNLGGWWLIHRLRSDVALVRPSAELSARFATIAARLRVERPTSLRISEAIAGPVTVGALKSVILLPLSAVSGLGVEELEVVLAHELAHVRRADYLWNLVQVFIETVFFFHPAVWWLSGRARHERELCCDDLALKACPDRVTYASALFRLEEQRSRQLRLGMALGGNQSRQTLRMRIARILGENMNFSTRPAHRPFSIIPVLACVVILAISAPQVIAGLRPSHPANLAAAVTKPEPVPVAEPQNNTAPESASAPPAVAPEKPAARRAEAAPAIAEPQQKIEAPADASATSMHYVDQMKALGYGDDLDKLIALKIQNVTPEYARAMAQAGFGKPTADELIACRMQGVTPEAIQEFKRQGLEVKTLNDAVAYKMFHVTPEFIAGMKAAGFADIDSKKLMALRVQNITPEYARSITQQFPGATVDDVMSTRIFHIDDKFIASAKAHGFKDLTLKKLLQLRISGLLDDETK